VAAAQAKNLIVDENDWREEMLYRSMDNLIETQTGGGDILNSSSKQLDDESKLEIQQ